MKIYVEIDENNTVLSYAKTGDNTRYISVGTDMNLDIVDIVKNYKLANGQLVELTEEEKEEYKQIDICSEEIKTTEELTKENEQLWDTVEYLLKQVNMIPEE